VGNTSVSVLIYCSKPVQNCLATDVSVLRLAIYAAQKKDARSASVWSRVFEFAFPAGNKQICCQLAYRT